MKETARLQNTLLKEIRLNIALLSRDTSHPLLSIKGAGLFDTKIRASSPLSLSLQQQIKQKYGNDALDKKVLNLKQYLSSLQLQPWPENTLQLNYATYLTVSCSALLSVFTTM